MARANGTKKTRKTTRRVTMQSEKIIPAQLECEEAILGSFLFDPETIYQAIDCLPEEAFYHSGHRRIYHAAIALTKQNRMCDLIAISDWLNARDELDEVGGTAKLAQLMNRTVSATNLDRYIELVLEKYIRRRMIETGNDIVDFGYDQTIELSRALEKAEDAIFKLVKQEYDDFEPEEAAITMHEAFNEMDSTATRGISTQILDLDRKIGGLKSKNLYIVAARASMGKTWFACNVAKAVAEQGKTVVFFSAEMSKKEISTRLLAMKSGVSSDKFTNGESSEEDKNAVAAILDEMSDLPVILDDSPARMLTPNSIRSKLRKIALKTAKPDLIILDYIQKLGQRSAVNRAQVIGEVAGELKDIAKEFDIPVLCLAQINRGTDARSDKRPMMSDIKDSGDIEQDADVIITLYRDEYYNPDTLDRGLMEINVAKNRNGEIGVCKCLFDPGIGTLKNLKEFIQGGTNYNA